MAEDFSKIHVAGTALTTGERVLFKEKLRKQWVKQVSELGITT